jgi:hypothetical protein
MKVFVPYGHMADQVNALRLQALGAVNGFTVYVPPAHTRQLTYVAPPARPQRLDPESEEMLRSSDVVLGVIGFGFSEACRLELNAAKAAGKPTIVMANPVHAAGLRQLGWNDVVEIDPPHPEQAESKIVELLKAVQAEQMRKALLAFGTLALGLLAVAAIAPQE